MKINKNYNHNSHKAWKKVIVLRMVLILILCLGIIPLLSVLMIHLLFSLMFQEIPYQVHHPAIYYVQDNFFQLGENVYYMKDGKCVAFDDKKETRQIDLGHISNDFYVSNDILYIYLDEQIYAYNSNLEEISIYETGSISGRVGRRFIVLGDYIYFQGYNYDIKKEEFYKLSMITHTKESLDWDGKYPAEFIFEEIYYKGVFHKFDDNIHYYSSFFSNVFYNEKYEKIEINHNGKSLIINDKTFDFANPFVVEEFVYLNSECFVFSTYTPQKDGCSSAPCISQLTDVKLWKYDIKAEQLSLIKQFNDYTILISFDENNYHYYYDGKLYSNDIEVEDAPKIEVGAMFTYYTSKLEPDLYREEILKSITSIAYISGEFYIIHEDINSDLKEFHWP